MSCKCTLLHTPQPPQKIPIIGLDPINYKGVTFLWLSILPTKCGWALLIVSTIEPLFSYYTWNTE